MTNCLAHPWVDAPVWTMFRSVARESDGSGDVLSLHRGLGVVKKGSIDGNHNRTPEDLTRYQSVRQKDVVVNRMKAWQGSAGVAPQSGIISAHYLVFEPLLDAYDSRFLGWLLQSPLMIERYQRASVGIRTSQWELSRGAFAELRLPRPPLETQRRVADMLDAETARIDTLIEKNERVIELAWRRYRVMRLNLLAGGYQLGSAQASEWATSKGWPVAPLWLLSMNHDSRRIPLNAEQRGSRQGPYPYWGANSIQDHIDDWLFDGPHVLIGEDGAPFFVEDRDVAWVAEGRYWVNNHAHVLQAVSVDTWWLAECLNVVDYSLFVTGSTRDKLTQDGLNRIPVPTPPREEQAEILRELDRARELASALVDRCRRQQELLRTRRHALITAAVTGQLEV